MVNFPLLSKFNQKVSNLVHQVDFIPLGVKVMCDNGATIFEVARENLIPIAESCGGEKVCGHCKVKIIEGMANLSQPDFEEIELMRRKNFSDDERLACAVKVFGDVKVTTSYW